MITAILAVVGVCLGFYLGAQFGVRIMTLAAFKAGFDPNKLLETFQSITAREYLERFKNSEE